MDNDFQQKYERQRWADGYSFYICRALDRMKKEQDRRIALATRQHTEPLLKKVQHVEQQAKQTQQQVEQALSFLQQTTEKLEQEVELLKKRYPFA